MKQKATINEDLQTVVQASGGEQPKQRPSQFVIVSPRSTERKIEVITAPAVIIKRDLFSRSPPAHHQPQQLQGSAPPRSLNVAKVNMAFSGIATEDRSLENPYAKIEALAKFKK